MKQQQQKKVEEFIEKTTIQLANKVIVLSLKSFEDSDMDEMTKIHHHNIIGEVLTISVALNRVGNLLATVTEILSEAKLDFEIFQANWYAKKRKELTFQIPDNKGGTKVDKPTQNEVENAVISSPEYKVKKQHIITLQKQWDIVNSWYWAMKDKSEKLNKLSDKLKPEDFDKEILEETINGVLIQSFKKTIS